ncbi:MAG: hypothetical protein V4683_08460 [Bacteroidota bacterium]
MKTLIKIIIIICIAFACSKKDPDPVIPSPTKCTNSTILDELLSGKQMYILATVYRGQVLLSIKDKKGKARTFGSTAPNAVLYEWDIQITQDGDTQVKLIAGEIIAVRGINDLGVYFPDSFFFNDDKCKIKAETNDGQIVSNRLSSYEDVTNSKDLPGILEKYLW